MDVSSIVAWIAEGGRSEEPLDAFATGLAERIVAIGVPLCRLSISFRTLHPEVWVTNAGWKRVGGARILSRYHEDQTSSEYLGSTVQAIHGGSGPIRQRLEVPAAEIPFPQLRGLAAEGATDYVIHPVVLRGGIRTFVSFATDRPDGFLPAQLEALAALMPVLGLRVELVSSYLATSSLLTTYLGANAARRVLQGDFRRGEGHEISALIYYCDLRGFTALADARPPRDVVRLLDTYFDCVAGPVEERGGEVLKFIGDAVLAILPVGDDGPAAAAALALEAAEASFGEMQARLGSEDALAFGIALHLGPVMYGNIGTRERLDFTVIGPAVNEASRVESLCKELGVPLLITDKVAAAAARDDLVSLGRHSLRGVREPRELFTLRRFRD